MTRAIAYRPQAAVDVEEITREIALQRPRVADRFLTAVHRGLQKLLDFPYLGIPWETANSQFPDARDARLDRNTLLQFSNLLPTDRIGN